MKYECFMIWDSQAEFFSRPFMLFDSKGQASGIFIDWMNDPKSEYYKHAEAYNLYYFGTFENCTGKFELLDAPVIQLKGFEVMKRANNVSPLKNTVDVQLT